MSATFPIVIAIVLMVWGPFATLVAGSYWFRIREAEAELARLHRQLRLEHAAVLRGASMTNGYLCSSTHGIPKWRNMQYAKVHWHPSEAG